MAKAMNFEVHEMPANEKSENQQDNGIAFNKLTNFKSFAIMAFENPGLCHVGKEIFKNLDIQTKLTCRLVRKSWHAVFEKQASSINRASTHETKVEGNSKTTEFNDTWLVRPTHGWG